MTQRRITPALLLVLALLSALAPLATDLYLPAFPQMTTDLGADATGIQLTLTAFLVGVAIGQLVFGPLSDRFGRLRPLLAGAVLCVAASALAVFAPDIVVLTIARFLQGFAGAAGMVIARAIISDLATGRAAARAFSLMMIVMGVAPVLAPFIGSLLVDPIGWRGILAVVLALGVVMFVAIAVVVRETHSAERRAEIRAARAVHGSPLAALRTRRFLGSLLAFAFGFAVMMAYISASPFLYQSMMGLDEVAYGVLFGVNALGLTAMNAINARLTRRFSVSALLRVGAAVILAASAGMLVLVLVGAPALALAAPIFIAVSALGMVMGNATALALGAVPHAAGSASALLGALQFGLGAAVSPLVSLAGEQSALPLAIVMLASALIAFVAALVATGRATAPSASGRGPRSGPGVPAE